MDCSKNILNKQSTNNIEIIHNFEYINLIDEIVTSFKQSEANSFKFNNPLLANDNFLKNFDEILINNKFINLLVNSQKMLNKNPIINFQTNTNFNHPPNYNLFNNYNVNNTYNNCTIPQQIDNNFQIINSIQSVKVNTNNNDVINNNYVTNNKFANDKFKEETTFIYLNEDLISNKRDREEFLEDENNSNRYSDISTGVFYDKKEKKEIKYVKKNSLRQKVKNRNYFGSKEEYSKFFKKEEEKINNFDFSEDDLKLVNFVNNPRKRIKRHIKGENNFLNKVQSKQKEQIKYFQPDYNEMIVKLKKDKGHSLMMNNFPKFYEIESFFDNIQLKSIRKENIKEFVAKNIESYGFINKNKWVEDCKLKKTWDANRVECCKSNN